MVKNLPANAGDVGSISGSEKSPGEGNDNLLVFLPRKSHEQRSLAGYSPWGLQKSRTWLKRLNNNDNNIYVIDLLPVSKGKKISSLEDILILGHKEKFFKFLKVEMIQIRTVSELNMTKLELNKNSQVEFTLESHKRNQNGD